MNTLSENISSVPDIADINRRISVIISAHNAARYLNDCLCSVENQTWRDMEIILLDDGSADETDAICRKHAEKDRRIRYFRFDEQKGLGARRNCGIELATGACIAFVDADDMIRNDMMQILMEELYAHDAQIAVCHLQTEPDFDDRKDFHMRIFDGKTAVRYFLADPAFGAFSCNKIFRKDVLKKNGKYPEDILYEDIVFIPQVCANAEKIIYADLPLYFYRQHQESITRSSFSPAKLDQMEAYKRLMPVLLNKFPELESLIYEKAFLAVMGIFNSMTVCKYNNEAYRRILLSTAKTYRKKFSVFRAANKKRTFIFSFALCAPGVYGVILRRLHRNRL